MDKSYNPTSIEDKNYNLWIDNNYHIAQPDNKKKPFSIVIPPPNVTGSLHIGHALNNTLQDILVRYKKMSGYDVLWVPGTDHAGIATQLMVERDLLKEGKNKHDLGRKNFIKRIWQWKDESGGQIIHQLKKLGALPDWSRERFTMDEGLSIAVTKVFVELYNEGLIFRDKRLVNWDPKLKTAISDLEVEQKEQKGKYWYIKYQISGKQSKFLVVATTRPETMLGDTAVAVHPEDERYKDIVGENAIIPLVDKEIPIISDEYSDPDKGTGAVKITPAHDFNDFEVGKRHNLEKINIFDTDGRINSNAPKKYIGLDRFEARNVIVNDLELLGLIVKVEDITHTVPYGDRSGEIIEPYLTDQWYVDTKILAKDAIKAVKNEEIKFYPKYWENTYFEWMNNIEPWCISRQIWWGHQIPAWYGPDGKVFVEENDVDAKNASKNYYKEDVELIRDTDVLDTWFSSGLWPFSTMGWPENTDEIKTYYPTQTLITGFDIIFFWVARMIMLGLKFTGKPPFSDIYIHGLIRDENGQKMSKTKGNVIDPLDVANEYGADSLRFSLTALASQGRDIKLSFPVIEGYRNFMNKIWNASRFVILNLDKDKNYTDEIRTHNLDIIDKWILNKLNKTIKSVNEHYSNYEYDKVANSIYHFIWNEYCDWYIELSKKELYGVDDSKKTFKIEILLKVLVNSLKLLHPISPYISEEIYQILSENSYKGAQKRSILLEDSPVNIDEYDYNNEYNEIEYIKEIVVAIRNIRANLGIHPSDKINIELNPETNNIKNIVENNIIPIQIMSSTNDIKIVKDSENTKSITSVIQGLEIILPVEGVIDVTKEVLRLEKDLGKLNSDLNKTSKKLSSKNFLDKAPSEVINKEKGKKEEFEFQINKIQEILIKLKKL